MKILDIQSQNGFSDKSVTIEFTTTEQTVQGKALYYFICAIDKMQGKNYNDLTIMEKSQVNARLDSAIDFINAMRK